MKKYISPKAQPMSLDTEDIMITSVATLNLDDDTIDGGVGVYAWPF